VKKNLSFVVLDFLLLNPNVEGSGQPIKQEVVRRVGVLNFWGRGAPKYRVRGFRLKRKVLKRRRSIQPDFELGASHSAVNPPSSLGETATANCWLD
jgi:hypothetical protein